MEHFILFVKKSLDEVKELYAPDKDAVMNKVAVAACERQQLTLTQDMVDRAVKSSDEMVKKYIEEGDLPKIV